MKKANKIVEKKTKKAQVKIKEVGKYDPKKIETKWAKVWEKNKTYKTKVDFKKKKLHVLDMFPYPSGEGLHVGHAKVFSASDIYSRFKRLQGYNVLHATGWDAFGLPAEQYALKNKVNPKISTKKNTENFERQMKLLGLSYDYDRTVNTTSPEFYKWTQWIFKQLYKDGLCFESYEPINWCPSCMTGLANEDLEDGKCERCGSVVEKKPIRQWVIKITEYAEKLLSGLNEVGWRENIKDMQRNWIGKSEGAEIDFKLVAGNSENNFTIFTTRPDTLFGCTYCVFAPEHKLIQELLKFDQGPTLVKNKIEVEKYIEETKGKSEIERGAEGKEKTGVKLEGVYAINPANQKQIPVYIADYVLASYGSGAIMAVPAHDERDFEFAKKFDIPVVDVVLEQRNPRFPDGVFRKVGISIIENSRGEILMQSVTNSEGYTDYGFPGGGIEEGDTEEVGTIKEVKEETGYINFETIKRIGVLEANYYSKNRKINRQALAYGYYFKLKNEDRVPQEFTELEKKFNIENFWVSKSKALEIISSKDSNSGEDLPFYKRFLENKMDVYTERGILFNSGEFDGMESEEAKKKITEFVGGKMVTKYKLRDWVFARQRYWGEPFPIVFDENHKSYLVADKDLPVKLPDVKNYEPTGDGESPLKNIKNWVEVYGFINKQKEFESVDIKKVKLFKKTKSTNVSLGEAAQRAEGVGTYKGNIVKKFTRETNTMPQWAGSSWYWLRYMDPKNNKAIVDKKLEKYWGQVDVYLGGMEHATRHLIYGRFWNRFLYDKKIISTKEPFKRLEAVGLVLDNNGRKMSKRLGNVINPDDVIAQFGADTLRCYIAFAGPYHQDFNWDSNNIVGARRFIERVWGLQNKIIQTENSEIETILHKTIKKCEEDYEKLTFNTAIAQMMIFVNAVEKNGGISLSHYITLLKLLSPIAPFATFEILENLQTKFKKEIKKEKLEFTIWPKWNAKKIQSKNVNIALQVNGKLRDTFLCDIDLSDEEVRGLAENTEGWKKWVVGSEIKKVIIIKNKIVNVVI